MLCYVNCAVPFTFKLASEAFYSRLTFSYASSLFNVLLMCHSYSHRLQVLDVLSIIAQQFATRCQPMFVLVSSSLVSVDC